MKKQKIQNVLYAAIIASETSHVFCCVLPTVFSVLSLLAGLGVVGVMPGWLEHMHETLHHWELPLIVLSGTIVAMGWGLHYYSKRIDCHDTGCSHGSCGAGKRRANIILKGATFLFFINVLIYSVFHVGMGLFISHTN